MQRVASRGLEKGRVALEGGVEGGGGGLLQVEGGGLQEGRVARNNTGK